MKKLLFSVTKKDFVIQTFRSGGPGGQNQNKVETGVRIIHPASGAVGESRRERSQHTNKQLAFKHLVESKKFQVWLKLETARHLTGKSAEDQAMETVERLMNPSNIIIDVIGPDGDWVRESKEEAQK